MARSDYRVVYWDTSALLSALFRDGHSSEAAEWAGREGLHLMSTLAHAEACAVIARMQRERILADLLIKAALEVLHEGPWRRLNASPQWETVQPLAEKWPLRGADLWHLATAKSLQKDLPELLLLTFDAGLRDAAAGEDLFRF
ncbi:MAG: type II toxin-antitoxin system VapC family toxin [Deltaproteobacteria bacterium]|nr:type II toxin-antitoxin system VapC family toxin [Deltaproteobacteria bacterium]